MQRIWNEYLATRNLPKRGKGKKRKTRKGQWRPARRVQGGLPGLGKRGP
jgi:hypothetical protein